MRPLVFTVLLLAAPTTLRAQWRLALLTGTAVTHGDARDETDPAHPEFHAHAPRTVALSLARGTGAAAFALELHHTSADLAEISASTAVTTRSALTAWGAALEFGRRVAGTPDGPTLHAVAGAGIDRWSFDIADGTSRWRASVRGALEIGLPVNPTWGGVIRGQVVAGPSVFNLEELPEGFVQRVAVRVGLVFGVSRRL